MREISCGTFLVIATSLRRRRPRGRGRIGGDPCCAAAGVRGRRRRLGARGRHEPVGRVRAGARRPHVRRHPLDLLPGHDARPTPRHAACGCSSRRPRRRSGSRPRARSGVKDAAGAVHQLAAGELALGPRLEIDVAGVATALTSPLTISPVGTAPLLRCRAPATAAGSASRATARPCRRSTRSGSSCTCRVSCRARCRRGWPLEALKAQAVAARTYALVSIVKGKPFDLYSDWRSQVYYGVEEESTATTRAVRETRGRILTFGGLPAQTLYFSSSGGRTRERGRRLRDGASVPRRRRRPVG